MPTNIIIDCTWPCPGENDQACILSETTLSCQQKQNSQWIWTDPHLSPQYDGEPARLYQPCITVPLPPFPTNIYTSANSTQSIVEWPPTDKYQPMDQFLSDCNPSTYCDQGTCVPKLGPGEACISTNQCRSGICNSNVCQKRSSPPPPSQQQQDQHTQTDGVNDGPWSKPTFTTSHLVGVIIAVIVLLGAILLFYFYRRRKRRIVTSTVSDDDSNNKSFVPRPLDENTSSPILPLSHIQNPSPPPRPISSSSSTSSTNINTTPSMQQQQLQFQLQRQHPSLSRSSTTSPPPYSP